MMKKFFILCILGLFLEGGGFCQEAVVKSISRTPASVTGICNRALGRCTGFLAQPGLGVTLAQRRVSAYVQAGKAVKNQSTLARDMSEYDDPFKTLDGRRFLDFYRKINPDGVELRTNQQALNYILSSANRKITYGITYAEATGRKLQGSLASLQQHVRTYTHPEEQDLAWLAQQIPEDTQYLLLGEIHNPFVMGHISPLMKELRARFGDRRIILLTEFLEEGDSSTLEDPEKYSGWFSTPLRQKIWTEAQANQISVFGLEPSVVYEHYSDFHFVSEYNHRENVWATNFGVDVRNHAWAKTIEQYHQENPDALIVVYAGISHLAYTSPFSLGLKLKKQAPTFLTSFTLGIPTSQEGVLQPISSFDLVTGGVFGQRIVHVAPEDAETAGFNIQLKFIDKYY